MKRLLAGFGVLLALSGCGDKSNQAAGTPAVETSKIQEKASTSPEQQQAGNNDAILARHMKCRQEQGADCFKILEELHKEQGGTGTQPAQQQMGKKEHNDAVMAKHMKCRQEQGVDCLKILDEMQK